MTTTDIKIELLKRGLTIAALAREFGCRREELSMCVRKTRPYPQLRERLAAELGIPEEKLFPQNTSNKRRAA